MNRSQRTVSRALAVTAALGIALATGATSAAAAVPDPDAATGRTSTQPRQPKPADGPSHEGGEQRSPIGGNHEDECTLIITCVL